MRLAYKGREWGSTQVELAPVEGRMGDADEIDRVPATPLDAVQLDGPETVACISVRYQLAQKLHACTEPLPNGAENLRFRDVMDILLLREFSAEGLPLSEIRAACVDIFTTRDTHAWPSAVTVTDLWREQFGALADENGFSPNDMDGAAARLTALIAEIDAAR